MTRTARIKLSDNQVLMLQSGETLRVNIPKDVSLLDVSLLEISTVTGDFFKSTEKHWDRLWREFETIFEKFRLRK
jgi:hypothetical protein